MTRKSSPKHNFVNGQKKHEAGSRVPDEHFEVEEILGERYSKRKGLEYRVRWKNFGDVAATWESVEDVLPGAAEAVKTFKAKNKKRKRKVGKGEDVKKPKKPRTSQNKRISPPDDEDSWDENDE